MTDRLKSKNYYDRGAKPLPELRPTDTVRMRTQHGTWMPARLLGEHPYQSYSLKNGRVYRRNRRDILKTRESPDIFERQYDISIPCTGDEHLPVEEITQTPNVPLTPTIQTPPRIQGTPRRLSMPTQSPIISTPVSSQVPSTSRFGSISKPNTRFSSETYETNRLSISSHLRTLKISFIWCQNT